MLGCSEEDDVGCWFIEKALADDKEGVLESHDVWRWLTWGGAVVEIWLWVW